MLLVHWHPEEARALRRALGGPPAALIISLSRLPSHGRETATARRQGRAQASPPIPLIGGQPTQVARVRQREPDAHYLEECQLAATIAALLPMEDWARHA